MRTLLWCSLLPCLVATACSTALPKHEGARGPVLHPDLANRPDERDQLLDAMRAQERDYAPPPPVLYKPFMGWPAFEHGIVVAIDGPMLAIRMNNPDKIPEHVLEMVMPISDPKVGEGILGDGVVTGRCADLLICRFFENRVQKRAAPAIGNSAYLDWNTREARK